MKQRIKCQKCDGCGYIEAFGHYAQGVCFDCGGAGTVEVDLDAIRAKLSDDNRRKAEWVIASTPASYERLGYGKLAKIRDFCHAGGSLQVAFPGLLDHWFAVGEAAFQAAQERRLEAFYAGRRTG